MVAAHRVRVEPGEVELEVAEGETLLQAAHRQGYYWPTVCGGDGECGACRCDLASGAEAALPAEEPEVRLLERIGVPTADGRSRLACRLRFTGPAVVTKRAVRRR